MQTPSEIDAMSDRALRADIQCHCDRIDADERRQEEIDSIVNDSMSHGGEFYPFSVQNFGEALAEIDLTTQLLLCSYFGASYDNHRDNQVLINEGQRCMMAAVVKYWRDIAIKQATRDYDKRR